MYSYMVAQIGLFSPKLRVLDFWKGHMLIITPSWLEIMGNRKVIIFNVIVCL